MRMFALSMIILAALVPTLAQEPKVAVELEVEDEVVKTYYIEAEDRTIVRVFIPLSIQIFGESSKFEISPYFSHRGQHLTVIPDVVQVDFLIPCKLANQLDSQGVICIGEECTSYRFRGGADCTGGPHRERTSRTIDLSDEMFLKIANGESVRIQLPGGKVELTRGQIKVLRSLANQMVPKNKKQSH